MGLFLSRAKAVLNTKLAAPAPSMDLLSPLDDELVLPLHKRMAAYQSTSSESIGGASVGVGQEEAVDTRLHHLQQAITAFKTIESTTSNSKLKHEIRWCMKQYDQSPIEPNEIYHKLQGTLNRITHVFDGIKNTHEAQINCIEHSIQSCMLLNNPVLPIDRATCTP